MPTDSTKKARLVLDRALVDQVQAEAVRRGLGEKSPSLLADIIFRDWLDASAAPGAPSLAERVAVLEAKLAAVNLANAPKAPRSKAPASTKAEAPEPLPAESPARPLRGRRARKALAKLRGVAPPWNPEGLRARMEALGYSARSLAEALNAGEGQVVRWLRGEEAPGHRGQLSKLLGA